MSRSFSLLGVLFVLIQSASSQPVAERRLPERGYLPGASIGVILTVPAIDSDTTLMEIPPAGWPVGIISSRYVDETGQITIPLRASAKPRTFQYCVTAPPSATGDYSFCGHIGGNPTTGMTTVSPMVIEPIGIFENHIDLGIMPYSKTEYDSRKDEYQIEVGMSLLGFYHFLYRKVSGDCSIQVRAKAQSDNPSFSFNSMVCLGIWDNLSTDSLWFGLETKANGDCWYGWGDSITYEKASRVAWPPFHDGRMRIERISDSLRAYYFDTELNDWTFAIEHTMDFEDPVYIGILAGCAQGKYNVGTFNEVVLTYDKTTSIANWEIF